MKQNILTAFGQQQMYQMRLFSSNNVDELLIIFNTSSSEKLEQFVVSIIRCAKAHDMFSLSPCETPDVRELGDKRIVSVNAI